MPKKKKNNKGRGPTFVGFPPHIEDTFKQKKEKKSKKHKNRIFTEN